MAPFLLPRGRPLFVAPVPLRTIAEVYGRVQVFAANAPI
jgi:hypothetical protein